MTVAEGPLTEDALVRVVVDDVLEQLLAEISSLRERVAALERRTSKRPAQSETPPPR